MLGTPLRGDRWVWVNAVLHGKSSDLGLLNTEETIFLATMVPLLLSVAFAKLRFPISQAVRRAGSCR